MSDVGMRIAKVDLIIPKSQIKNPILSVVFDQINGMFHQIDGRGSKSREFSSTFLSIAFVVQSFSHTPKLAWAARQRALRIVQRLTKDF